MKDKDYARKFNLARRILEDIVPKRAIPAVKGMPLSATKFTIIVDEHDKVVCYATRALKDRPDLSVNQKASITRLFEITYSKPGRQGEGLTAGGWQAAIDNMIAHFNTRHKGRTVAEILGIKL